MSELLEATYEGNGLIRLKEQLKGIYPHANLKVIVITTPTDETFVTEESDLWQQLQSFEKQYKMPTITFYNLFQSGQLDDSADYISWAALYEFWLQDNQ
ncbi:MAG: hypothetical protein H6668_03940 [Ardenticatenaceae bacterium]|nr:hypothetical protein [Ardenticatenaceae bacterium]